MAASSPSQQPDSWWGRLVRFGFRLLYHEMAWTYDAVAWAVSLGQWRAWQRAGLRQLDPTPGERVLEIAHGTGNLQIDLAEIGCQRMAIDFSPQMGRLARRKLIKQRISPHLVRARAQDLPFGAASFDGLISTFPTPFIIEAATLAEAYRVLKPGGCFVIVPNAVLTRGGLAKDALEAAYRLTGQRGPWPVDIEQRFAEAGFELQHITEQLPRSVVQIVSARKPLNDEP